ncbi:hypothetical protein [Hymenobacter guriensis]|uniref:Lipoprotein n=1 Tax=Hymenobacter guriensis TaxID=2793065 RepID=A0ABS0L229_9BACT|nr:hypothetical protein [Hymenobacter guriensis]MBG8554172.1 hypothetical protein [Hymenobacter guriensis]
MRPTLLCLLFCVGTLSATHAQTVATPDSTRTPAATTGSADDWPTQYSRAVNDTVQAIQRLYGRRRTGGFGWMISGGVGGLRSLLAASQEETITTSYGTVVTRDKADAGGILTGVAIIGVVEAYGVSKLVRFSSQREAAMIELVRQGKRLPDDLRRRLKPRFFLKRK